MPPGIKVKYGSFPTGKRDRDAPKRLKKMFKATLVLHILGHVIATQIIAHMMDYAAALGRGLDIGSGVKIFPPYKWVSWIAMLLDRYGLGEPTVAKMLGIALASVILCTIFPIILYMRTEKAREERAKIEAIHGGARWAEIEDIRESGLLPPEGQTKSGVYVGGYMKPKKRTLGSTVRSMFGKDDDGVIYLKHDGPEHILAYAPTRSGKGVGLVLPTLLNWPNSCIVLDIKGENFSLTSGWRKQNAGRDGSYILKFDPLDTTGKSARYNPLNEIRLGTDYEHADIENLSMLLADPTGKGTEGANAHWVNTSSSLLICLIYHMLFKCQAEGEEPTLEMLRTMFTAPAPELNDQQSEQQEASEEAADAFKEQTLKPIMTFCHNPNVDVSHLSDEEIRWQCKKIADPVYDVVNKWPTLHEWRADGLSEKEIQERCKTDDVRQKLFERVDEETGEKYYAYYTRYDFGLAADGSPLRTHPKAAENANEAYQRNSKEAGSVLSTAANALKLYADKTVSSNLRDATFRLFDLMNADKPVTLYLVVPPAQLSRLIPIMRIMVTQVITILADKLRFEAGQTKGKYAHKMLLMLDEFPTLGNMEAMETSLAFIAGYGLKAYLIIQDLKQLYKKYSKEESITSNCHVQVLYAPNNIDTAKQISEMLGNQTILVENVSTSTSKGVTTTSKNLQAQSRALMSPDAVMALEGPTKDEKGMIKKPGQMIVKVAGFPPILGRQILYFLDETFSRRSKKAPVEHSDVLMRDLHRTYVRPRYDWLSDEEYKANKEEDERENDLANRPRPVAAPAASKEPQESEPHEEASKPTAFERDHTDIEQNMKEVLGEDKQHEKEELPADAPAPAREESKEEYYDESQHQPEIEDEHIGEPDDGA